MLYEKHSKNHENYGIDIRCGLTVCIFQVHNGYFNMWCS